MRKKKYILFDLDGTLTDPKEGITKSVQHSLRRFGIEEENLDALCPFIGPPLRDSYMKFYGFSEEQATEAIGVYREYFCKDGWVQNKVYPGIRRLLKDLRSAGRKLYVATSKPEPFAVQILEHFELAEFFDFIGGACMNESRTDKYEVIEYVIESCNITDRNEVVMVGDRSHDMIGAKKAGLHSIGVLYGYGSKEELEQSGAEMLVEVPEQIVSLMEV